MSDRVELAFRRAATGLIPARGSILAAVSGGGDSVALLHLLRSYGPRRDEPIVVAHLDHGLRPGSAEDRAFVVGLAEELGLTAVTDRRDVSRLRRRSESPEEAARRVRRGFLLEAARQSGCSTIATGHTLDDQAETVLMRLVRGAGATALCGMAPCGPGPFVRPLLTIERRELRRYLARRRLRFLEDPSNSDLRFDRNRVRRLVLPILEDALNPRAARSLVGAAERLREDALHLDELARSVYERLARRDRSGRLELEVAEIRELVPPIAKRVLRLALRDAGADPRRIASRHIEALMDLAGGHGNRRLALPGRTVALRGRERIVFDGSPGLSGQRRRTPNVALE